MTSPNSLHLVLLGHANAGKTTLFNTLTGYRQKVANYAGVTVDYKTGDFLLPSGRYINVTDLPGIYSFHSISPDETITQQFCYQHANTIDLIICIIDATKLSLQLNLILQIKALKKPVLLLLNRVKEATDQGIVIDEQGLAKALGIPVIAAQVKQPKEVKTLIKWLDQQTTFALPISLSSHISDASIAQAISTQSNQRISLEDKLDKWLLHPILGPIFLVMIMGSMSQMIFAFAEPIKQLIETSIISMGYWITYLLPKDSLLHHLLNESIFQGLATVFAFLPQILILFGFIFILEESGYLPRAVFLLDHLLYQAGLTGRAFIPLLSSFACTIPSIMATRNIQHPRDRLITILVLPLITCSARLPIYILLIAAFIPAENIFYGLLNLQGAVLFGLYILGMSSALLVAWVMKKLQKHPIEPMLLMELPNYQIPRGYDILLGLWQQSKLFCYRIGNVIIALNILLWLFCRFPAPPTDAIYPPIYYSIAGYLGRLLTPIFAPIGFNWQICIALIPGLMAREVAISSLSTVYAMSSDSTQLSTVIANQWSLATALALLAWYVFAPQCLSTLTVIRKETKSTRSMIIATSYLFSLAYIAAFLTYQITRLWQ